MPASLPSLPRRKLPARYYHIVLPLCMSLVMSCIISAVVTWRAVGLTNEFVGLWLHAWPMSWATAFPILMIILPMMRKFVAMFVEEPGARKPKV